MRWSVYRNGKRTQPTHIIASVKTHPKKSEVEPLAADYFQRVNKSRTVQAGASMAGFVKTVFFPQNKERLKRGTVALYRQQWKRLEPYLGNIRLRGFTKISMFFDWVHV
jgi:hypothetical protein